jgi:hypothetical protein
MNWPHRKPEKPGLGGWWQIDWQVVSHDVWVPSGSLDGKLIHLEPLGCVGGPIKLLNSRWLEVQGPTNSLQVLGERLDYSCIMPSFGRTLLVRLVINKSIVIIIPFFTLLLFKMLALLALVLAFGHIPLVEWVSYPGSKKQNRSL